MGGRALSASIAITQFAYVGDVIQFPMNEAKAVKVLSIPCEPGTVELSSPDAFTRWIVTETQENREYKRYFDTGPATRELVYLKGGGSVTAMPLYQVESHVRQSDGFPQYDWKRNAVTVVAAPEFLVAPVPELRARFIPGMGPSEIASVKDSVSCVYRQTVDVVTTQFDFAQLPTLSGLAADIVNAAPIKYPTGINRRVSWSSNSPVMLSVVHGWANFGGSKSKESPIAAASSGSVELGAWGSLWWLGNPETAYVSLTIEEG